MKIIAFSQAEFHLRERFVGENVSNIYNYIFYIINTCRVLYDQRKFIIPNDPRTFHFNVIRVITLPSCTRSKDFIYLLFVDFLFR